MLDKVIEIVREAGCLMQNRDFTVESKGTISNNVTSADLAVQDFLESRLASLSDNSVFIGEEGNFNDVNNSAQYRWMLIRLTVRRILFMIWA
jgi:myo-inositol-1(or 4)-monophosphatase